MTCDPSPTVEIVDLALAREIAEIRRAAPRWFQDRASPGTIERCAELYLESQRVGFHRIGRRKWNELFRCLRQLGMTPLARAEARRHGFMDGGHFDGGDAA